MNHRTFFWFILPSLLAMTLFIALPMVSVVMQSLYVEHEKVILTVENCGPFGCTTSTTIDQAATEKLLEEQPLGKFNGISTYTNRAHLAFSEVGTAWSNSSGIGEFFGRLNNLPFYRALFFTLAYTFIVTPLVIVMGFFVALSVNSVTKSIKGPVIFFSLLPMIVTPLIGSLILFWMIDSRGIVGASIQALFADPNLSLKASPTLTWITLFVYGIWHGAPFAFVVFYAGLQGVPQDTLESAMIDGATRAERIRYVVVPHLAPLVTFVALIQLMDNFRMLEPIIGFNAEASATSLSYIIYADLKGEQQLFSSAAATSVLTIFGVAILLLPVLIRTWRDFNAKTA